MLRYLTKYASFCHVVGKYTNEPRFLWSYWTKFTKFLHDIEASFALLTRT